METIRFNENRTFGMEFEVVLKSGYYKRNAIDDLRASGINVRDGGGYFHNTSATQSYWEVKTDASIVGNGFELVSPVLKGLADLEQVEKVCEILTRYCDVNKSTGFHVHHGASDFVPQTFKNLYKLGYLCQGVANYFVSPSRRNNHYAGEIHRYLVDDNSSATAVMTKLVGLSRYKAINFASYTMRNTIEFRQHQGTTEFPKVKAWVVFTQRLMEKAVAAKTIRAKKVETLSQIFILLGMRKFQWGYNGSTVKYGPDEHLEESQIFLAKRFKEFKAGERSRR